MRGDPGVEKMDKVRVLFIDCKAGLGFEQGLRERFIDFVRVVDHRERRNGFMFDVSMHFSCCDGLDCFLA